MQKKARGQQAEQLVVDALLDRGMRLLDRNRTMVGGELDIVATHDDHLWFIEVKSVDYIDDIAEYMTHQKLHYLYRAINHWLHEKNRSGTYQLDVVFVKEKTIIERFQNITNE